MTIPKLAQQLYFDTPKQEDEEVLFVEPVQDEEQESYILKRINLLLMVYL